MPDPVHYDFDPVEIAGDQPRSVAAEPYSASAEDPSRTGDETPIYRSAKVFETIVHGEKERPATDTVLRESIVEPHESAVDRVVQEFVTVPHGQAIGYVDFNEGEASPIVGSRPTKATVPPYGDFEARTARLKPSASAPAVADKRSVNDIVDAVIPQAERLGLPVRFLRDVRKNDYTFVQGDPASLASATTSPWFNRVVLNKDDVEALSSGPFRLPLSVASIGAIVTLYHESVHAYFDLHSGDPMISGLQTLCSLDYSGSPLTTPDGEKTWAYSDEIFQEAAGAYVQKRISVWLNTLYLLITFAEDKQVKSERVEDALTELEDSYNAESTKRVFGYAKVGSLFSKEIISTTVPIRAELKHFLDTTILEGRIPDRFEEVPAFRELAQKARRRIPR